MPTRLFLSSLLVLLVLGCSGTETGNPGKSTAALGLTAHSSSSEVVIGAGASGVRIESAWLEASGLVQVGCASGQTEAIAGEFSLNLLEPSGGPEVHLAEPELCSLELALAPGAELGPSSIVVSGVRADDAPFVIASPAALAVTLQASAPIDPTGHQALLFAFDLAIWLSGTDLAGAALDAEGVARIDGSLHPSTVVTFDSQIALGAGLYPDLDADGVLDEDERAVPLAGH